MSSHFKWALTHFVFGVLLIVMGIVDLGLCNYTFWSIGSGGFFVIFCGVWVGISLAILCCKRKENKVTYFSLHQVFKGQKVRSEPFLTVCTRVRS